jgi:hypothetical protein
MILSRKVNDAATHQVLESHSQFRSVKVTLVSSLAVTFAGTFG